MANKYAALMGKSMFIGIVVEGTNPSTPVTKNQLAIWINGLKTPFTFLRDPDGADFAAKKIIGNKMTTYIVERATRKILVVGDNEADTLPELEKLP